MKKRILTLAPALYLAPVLTAAASAFAAADGARHPGLSLRDYAETLSSPNQTR
jgi:hypothetical protein